ncbi:Fic family protein, partial [bacterium]|nr:Fic family protein [bacterium]MBU1917610.1 Fic family protein [bacterium]
MKENHSSRNDKKPAGYEELILRYNLLVIPNWHHSFVSTGAQHKIYQDSGVVFETYPSKYWPGETVGDHLEFAIKYDGINLAILASLFQVIEQKKIIDYIQSKPIGKYARRVWFLYEFITNSILPFPDLSRGNYVDLLDSKKYYTLEVTERVRRQRVNNNLLGNAQFCPTVRRTECLHKYEKIDFAKSCEKVISQYSPVLLRRALSYLYTKETKSSFEIEHVKPNSTRTERFVTMLEQAEKKDFCEKQFLIDLQNQIVDPRFCDKDYRSFQNYVGESVSWQREKVHFICPKPADLPSLMEGLMATHKQMDQNKLSAIVHAATIAYGFVFLHPFEDGNGRIHRLLIHNILARADFTPKGIMFPVSAAMLKNLQEYDLSLEAFSHPLMSLIDYSLDEQGHMIVHNDTLRWYQYIDMTVQVEALFCFIEQTINTELAEELTFLANYDEAKEVLKEVVDMPDRKIDLFIRFCLQNNFILSSRKRD